MKIPLLFSRNARLGLPLALVFLTAGCRHRVDTVAAGGATVVQFHADGSVRNPAASDAFPGVRRIVVRALDNRARPDPVAQVTDRVGMPAGPRTLLLAAESTGGRVTLSELSFEALPGADYTIWPAPQAEGRILADLRRGTHGEVVAKSRPWSPLVGEAGLAKERSR